MKYWEHDETGLITNCGYEPSGRWYEIPTVYEDELPEVSEKEYARWYALSAVVDGVRVGPDPFAVIPLPRRFTTQRVASTEGATLKQHQHTYAEGGRHCAGCGVLRDSSEPSAPRGADIR